MEISFLYVRDKKQYIHTVDVSEYITFQIGHTVKFNDLFNHCEVKGTIAEVNWEYKKNWLGKDSFDVTIKLDPVECDHYDIYY